jgi:hypothetical protein
VERTEWITVGRPATFKAHSFPSCRGGCGRLLLGGNSPMLRFSGFHDVDDFDAIKKSESYDRSSSEMEQ